MRGKPGPAMKISSWVKIVVKLVILACFALFVVLPVGIVLWMRLSDKDYNRFCRRDTRYFEEFAGACDALIAQAGSDCRHFGPGELPSLPAAIREANPQYIEVCPTSVLMRVGGSAVIWASDPSNRAWWNLEIRQREARAGRRLFSKTKPYISPTNPWDGGLQFKADMRSLSRTETNVAQ